jgi:hypothetical protein
MQYAHDVTTNKRFVGHPDRSGGIYLKKPRINTNEHYLVGWCSFAAHAVYLTTKATKNAKVSFVGWRLAPPVT